uniref:Solute carrier family 40 member n=1 Tax=Diospyros kaki TaxID=35925 RepID=H1A8M8_DIOKA|nr:ferroportin [Diospyros kaki]
MMMMMGEDYDISRMKYKEEEDNMAVMINEPLLIPQQPSFPESLLLYLYVGHFLSRWSARMWEFSVGLYMIDFMPNSLLLAAVYGVVESASTALFGPLVGQWVDSLTYVKVVQLWSLMQNLSFIVAGGSVLALLVYLDSNFTAFVSLVILTNISGAIGVLSTLAGTILIEREWVVVISEGQPPNVLTEMNSVIRRIDLICKLFAPVLTGFIISFISLKASALALSLWNVISVCLQYWLLMSVYNGIPALRERNKMRLSRSRGSPMLEERQSPSTSVEESNLLSNVGNDPDLPESNWKTKMISGLSKDPLHKCLESILAARCGTPSIVSCFVVFYGSQLWNSNDSNTGMGGYTCIRDWNSARSECYSRNSCNISVSRLQSQISTLRTGLWSIWSQWVCLLICLASIWVQNKLASAYMLMGGVAASRLGLWMFDLSVIQQMQDQVPESDRIVVGGVQNSLQSVLDLMTYVMGIVISNPQDFWKLTMISFVLVTTAAGLYSLHIYRVRKHLIHWEKLFRF